VDCEVGNLPEDLAGATGSKQEECSDSDVDSKIIPNSLKSEPS